MLRRYFGRPACPLSRLIIRLTSAQLGLAGNWAELGNYFILLVYLIIEIIKTLAKLPLIFSTNYSTKYNLSTSLVLWQHFLGLLNKLGLKMQ